MAYDKFLIGFTDGESSKQGDLRPWLIADNAFTELNNAYVFRGRVRKRFGSRFMGSGWSSAVTEPLFSRLRINLGNTDGSGNISVAVPGIIFKVGQMFSIGSEIFTVAVTGTPGVILTTGASTVHTYNTTTGALVINGAAVATPVWFYPAEPVMGLTVYEKGPVNNQPSYAFDTQFAYLFAGGFWQRSGTAVWHGNNLNFFWSTNWRGITPDVTVLFVTNFNATLGAVAPAATDDPIWSFDGTTWTPHPGSSVANGFFFLPGGNAKGTGPFVQTARIIVPFKNRLVFLNTVENDNAGGGGTGPGLGVGTATSYVNRARFSFDGSPFAPNAWYEPGQFDSAGAGIDSAAGGGDYVDAPTEEAIISAEFIKDRLIVFFERSTWELAFTQNQVSPFAWQKINTELGSEAQFSTVPFDKVILAIGNTGVHACNGANVERIDDKIPNDIFRFVNKDVGVQRVCGIRDYYVEMVYWTFPYTGQNPAEVYPSKVLVYNYKNGSWAFNDDCITTFGYFEQQAGMTWASTTLTWEIAAQTWASGTNAAEFRQVIAGNQEGYVFIIDTEEPRNARNMQITNIVQSGSRVNLTIIDHTLNDDVEGRGDWIIIENVQGATLTNTTSPGLYQIYQITFVDINTVSIAATLNGTYTGGGTASRVSNIQINSKQWNPYDKQGSNFYLAKIDFGVLRTTNGEITVDYYPSASTRSLIKDGTATGTILGNNILETKAYDATYYPLEQWQDRIWHPIYFQADGECVQISISFSDLQISTPDIAFSEFELDGIILYTQKSSSRLQ